MSQLTGSIATTTVVVGTTASAPLIAGNEFRKNCIIHNNSGQILYVLFATTGATATLHTVSLANQANYLVPLGYTGPLCGALATGTGDILITEVV